MDTRRETLRMGFVRVMVVVGVVMCDVVWQRNADLLLLCYACSWSLCWWRWVRLPWRKSKARLLYENSVHCLYECFSLVVIYQMWFYSDWNCVLVLFVNWSDCNLRLKALYLVKVLVEENFKGWKYVFRFCYSLLITSILIFSYVKSFRTRFYKSRHILRHGWGRSKGINEED